MGKLGKKARKFAKKHLPSVMRMRRKTKALFKKKAPKGGHDDVEKPVANLLGHSRGRNTESEGIVNVSLEAAFIENDKNEVAEISDSDGYLSEDRDCVIAVESETDKTFEDEIGTSTYSDQNKKIQIDLGIQKKKLDRLRKKDPNFSKFLESIDNSAETFQNEDMDLDGGEPSDQGASKLEKLLTKQIVNTWCKLVIEEHSQSALVRLLNAYRTACHYGAKSIGHRIENSETFSHILLFTLSNADDLFRGQLQISSLNSTKELQDLKKNPKWKHLTPLVKSYIRSTLFLLNLVTDADILAFAMMRLRASLVFFVAFPSLLQRLIEAAVHLWATGGRPLSAASYLLIQDIASITGSNFFDNCLSSTLVAFISRSRVTEIVDINHMQFLRDCTVKLCSLDVQKSSLKAVASITQLAKILSWGMQTKKEALRKICSCEYVNCIDLWVMFISSNLCDHDLESLLLTTIQLINALAHMFPGPRYFPLRLKCIKWLNLLSSSSGTFIPLVALVMDLLEYKVVKEGKKAKHIINLDSVVKLPKHYLKSRSFQDQCFHSAAEQLSFHFSQWSYHISFPDLANIPLIRLRKVHETTTVESLRHLVKRMIYQVEQNVDFVQKKRDEVSFSQNDHQSAGSFIQLEKSNLNTSFMQYYKSVLYKAAERDLHNFGKISFQEQKNLKRIRTQPESKRLLYNTEACAIAVAENGTVDIN